MEFVKYGGGSVKKGKVHTTISDRIYFQIRKKDQRRFFELLDIEV